MQPTPSLRERSKARRRQAIVDAARELFAERGYANTTIADIAEAADVAPRTVSLYFNTKMDIACADAADAVDRLLARIADCSHAQSTVEIFMDWLHAELTSMDQHRVELNRRVRERNPEIIALGWALLKTVAQTAAQMVSAELGVAVDDPRTAVTVAAIRGMFEYAFTMALTPELESTIHYTRVFLEAGMQRLAATSSE